MELFAIISTIQTKNCILDLGMGLEYTFVLLIISWTCNFEKSHEILKNLNKALEKILWKNSFLKLQVF